MKLSILPLLLAPLLPTLSAQIQLSVQTAGPSGIAFEFPGGSRTVQAFPANTAFPGSASLRLVDGSPLPLFAGSATMDLAVSPPTTMSLPFPLAVALDRVTITNGARATPSVGPVSMHTTDNANGDAGTQRYDVVLTAAGNTQALVTLRLTGEIWDNTSLTTRVTGAGINQVWSLTNPQSVRDSRQFTIPVNGTATLRVEITGVTSPGSGPTTLFWEGYTATLAVDAYDLGRAAFNIYGNGCGNGTISGSGTPMVGQTYTVNLDNAPANAMVMLVVGDSRTRFQFLQLPLPLGYMGATGCELNVAPINQAARITDGAGHADVSFTLSRFVVEPTFYLQWLVFDANANQAGFTLTRGAELLW